MRYQFIGAHQTEHRLARFCAALEVSRSGYYAWRARGTSRCRAAPPLFRTGD